MSVPTIDFAYLDHDRADIIIVCRVDSTLAPLQLGVNATNGWVVLFNGVTQSLFTGYVATPRPNCITIALENRALVSDVVKIYYFAAGSQIEDQGHQLLATVLQANAITVLDCLPVVDLIARDVAARLGEITRANGYLFDLSVEDDLKNVAAVSEGKTWVSYDDPVIDGDGPINHEQFTAAFHIFIATAISTASDRPLTSKEYQIEAEVMKLLQVDYNRNHLAVDTIPLAMTRIDFGVGGWGGISVNFNVRFRTLYGNRFDQ